MGDNKGLFVAASGLLSLIDGIMSGRQAHKQRVLSEEEPLKLRQLDAGRAYAEQIRANLHRPVADAQHQAQEQRLLQELALRKDTFGEAKEEHYRTASRSLQAALAAAGATTDAVNASSAQALPAAQGWSQFGRLAPGVEQRGLSLIGKKASVRAGAEKGQQFALEQRRNEGLRRGENLDLGRAEDFGINRGKNVIVPPPVPAGTRETSQRLERRAERRSIEDPVNKRLSALLKGTNQIEAKKFIHLRPHHLELARLHQPGSGATPEDFQRADANAIKAYKDISNRLDGPGDDAEREEEAKQHLLIP